ncbi:MAG: MFS transporter [Marmoricola sp.]
MTTAAVPDAARLTRRGVPTDPTLRILALGTLVNRAGTGATVTAFALYFTRVVGLSAAQVGVALSVAGLVGMLVQVPLGHLGDVRGPRGTMRLLTYATGLTTLGLLAARRPWELVVVMAAVQATQAGANAVRNGYIARIATGGQGVAFKAYLRAVTNVAMTFGALLGGLALAVDRPWAYLTVFAVDAASSLATASLFLRLPQLPPAPARAAGEPRLAVLRDTPYVVVTLLTGVVSMHFIVMEVGIPLWIGQHTTAPTAMVAVLLALNTVSVSLFQVRLSRHSVDVPRSARAMVLGTGWIAAGFAVIACSDGPGAWLATALLVVGAGVHVVGEMVASGGQWGVQMGLAPPERQGQYQGFAGLGFGLAGVVAPTLITVLCIGWGRPGWFVMAGLILGAGLALQPASAWALRTRERYGAATASG